MLPDAFLYIKSLTHINQDDDFYGKNWWPHVSFYILNDRHRALKVFVKSERSRYFDEIKKVLNVEDLQFIVDVLNVNKENSYHSNPYIPSWTGSFATLNLKTLSNLEKLHKS